MVAALLKDEQPDRRRQIAVLALLVDAAYELRQMNAAIVRNLPACIPEHIFKADAGFVTGDDNGSLDDPGFEMPAARAFFGNLSALRGAAWSAIWGGGSNEPIIDQSLVPSFVLGLKQPCTARERPAESLLPGARYHNINYTLLYDDITIVKGIFLLNEVRQAKSLSLARDPACAANISRR